MKKKPTNNNDNKKQYTSNDDWLIYFTTGGEPTCWNKLGLAILIWTYRFDTIGYGD